jgi:hypothetical protein
MSSSVIVARTRMWRTMVPIMRGENFCGAAWQRPQFDRKRRSPSTRMASAATGLRVAGTAVPSFFPDDAAPHTTEAMAKTPPSNAIFIFTADLLDPMGRQTGTRDPLSKD